MPIRQPRNTRCTTPITATVAAQIIGLPRKLVAQLIRDRLLAGISYRNHYYTSRHACRVFLHGVVTCAPCHVPALVDNLVSEMAAPQPLS